MNIRIANAYAEFKEADDLWSDELSDLFSHRAGDVRYTSKGKGEDGSRLREYHDRREAARIEWEAATAEARQADTTKGGE